jgi:Xaa-Pro aminopeptidase
MDARITNLRTILKEQNLDAVLVSSVPNITYLSGYGGFSTEERDAFLFITKKNAYIITNALYITAIREHVTHLIIIEQTRDNPLRNILSKLVAKHAIKRIGFEDANLSVAEYTNLKSHKKLLTPINLEDLRVVKTQTEIDAIKKACEIGDAAFAFIKTKIKIGMTEQEVANLLEMYMKQQQADSSFRTIVAIGKNAAIPHHLAGDSKLKANTNILLDFGVRYELYCSDMTRNIFFGKATKEYRNVYQTVLDAQQKAIEALESMLAKRNPEKISMKDIDRVARDYIISKGYPSIPHTLGHGIGLEVHEGFRLYHLVEGNFANGMVFSIEPGIYVPNQTGVRIEDLFSIEKNKLVRLTNASRELIEL